MRIYAFLTLVFSLYTSFIYSQIDCGIQAGAIQIISVDSDPPDNFCFMALEAIPAGTDWMFVDKGWSWDDGCIWGEGGSPRITYTVPSSGLSCGDIICLSAPFNLGNNGDQVIAICPTQNNHIDSLYFIAGIHLNGDYGSWDGSCESHAESMLPQGLSSSIALAFGEADNVAFDCSSLPANTTDCDLIKAAVRDYANYEINPSTPFQPTYSDCLVALPVELTMFDVLEKSQEKISLQWEVATELNTLKYVLERSHDGIQFSTIANIPALGSHNSYYYEDRYPLRGNSYYRLKMLDRDGSYMFSEIIHVQLDSFDRFTVYPTHAKDFISIENGASISEKVNITVYNLNGQRVKFLSIDLLESYRISITDLSKGTYFIVLEQKGDIYKSRFVKE